MIYLLQIKSEDPYTTNPDEGFSLLDQFSNNDGFDEFVVDRSRSIWRMILDVKIERPVITCPVIGQISFLWFNGRNDELFEMYVCGGTIDVFNYNNDILHNCKTDRFIDDIGARKKISELADFFRVRDFLYSEINFIREMLEETPEDRFIEKIGLEGRLELKIKEFNKFMGWK